MIYRIRFSHQTEGISRYFFLENTLYQASEVNFSSLQVEYAVKAVENGGTAIGIRCKNGVVLAVEKIISSKLLKPGSNKRIATVDRNVGVVCSGIPRSCLQQSC